MVSAKEPPNKGVTLLWNRIAFSSNSAWFCDAFSFTGKALRQKQVLAYTRKQESCFYFKHIFFLISILMVGTRDLFGVLICAL